jgi:membrane protease subunit HflC
MKTSPLLSVLAIIIGGVALFSYFSFYTLNPSQQALVLRLGAPVGVRSEPGLHFKIPLLETVVLVDKRYMLLDAAPFEVIASDQKRLVVDAVGQFRVVDSQKFYEKVGTVAQAERLLQNFLTSAVRRVVGEVTFITLVREQRAQLMRRITEQMNAQADTYGIQVADVKIRRADLPEANSAAIYERMKTERQREAAEIRAQGDQASRRIRAEADREVTVIKAEATRQSEQTRGDGDAAVAKIYADAYGRDPEFFDFYRSMQAYTTGLKADDTRLVMSPDSEFFRYFASPDGRTAPAASAAPAGAPGAAPPPARAPAQ